MSEPLESDFQDGRTPGRESEVRIDNPSSSSDSSDSDDEEAAGDLELEALEKELTETPSNYDAHVKYIRLLRKLGNIEKLRQAREKMNALFPLSSTMWQEWTKDEISLSDGSEAFTQIEKLFERAVQEYLSVPLWCDYVNFVEEHDQSVSKCTPAGISKMRDLFERALTATGLHVTEGHKIWEAYREYEQALLLTIEESDMVQEKEKQVQRIRSLFHRQLSVPHSELRSTLLAYKMWETEQGREMEMDSDDMKGVPPHIISLYQKAQQMYNVRDCYEGRLSDQSISDTDRFQQFMTYIKFEESCGDPVRVQNLYERAVSEYPVSSDLWLSYTRYVDRNLKVSSVVRNVYSRATKNCSWIGELWSRYLLALERANAPEEEISLMFEQSLHCAFVSIEEYLDMFLTRIDGLRRRISLPEKTDLSYATIRSIFQHAIEYLSPQLKNTESLLRLYCYWARLEMKLAEDSNAAREVWESLIKESGSMLEAWQSYIAMEIEAGHINEARSLYKRCYSKRFPGTGSEDMCYSWIRFEREYGTLEDFDLAERKVMPRLQELNLFRSQQESQAATASAAQEVHSAKTTSQKRKNAAKSAEEQLPPKKQKTNDQVAGSAKDMVQKKTQAKTTDIDETEPKVEANTSPRKVNKFRGANGQPSDDTSANERKAIYKDQCTAFVSNLNLETKDDHLRDFFSDVGGVTAIRLLRDKFTGKSRGLAYVDFSDDKHLAAAVAKNKQRLQGKKLSIARSDPNRSQKKTSSRSSGVQEHGGHNTTSDKTQSGDLEHQESSETARPDVASVSHRRGSHVQLTGKNTFAMPRSVVRPLGWSANEPEGEESTDRKFTSNDEFRNLLVKK
ncbi:hypothetical protein H6P81_001548 [Aristolochia fimbriata]|uniref:RRM domain-containing protein n=1 Tax=Aristolochia fimbriata TaxID=158543 RepID=A0AAV7F775_ARIFI|nr:hypothetical protein H6P81_001548 [Aristolochia fimbriata]